MVLNKIRSFFGGTKPRTSPLPYKTRIGVLERQRKEERAKERLAIAQTRRQKAESRRTPQRSNFGDYVRDVQRNSQQYGSGGSTIYGSADLLGNRSPMMTPKRKKKRRASPQYVLVRKTSRRKPKRTGESGGGLNLL